MNKKLEKMCGMFPGEVGRLFGGFCRDGVYSLSGQEEAEKDDVRSAMPFAITPIPTRAG